MKVKDLLIASAILMGSISLGACSGGSDKNVEEETVVFTVDSLNSTAENLIGDTIEVSGLCTHLCQHGGTKAFIQGADSTVIIRCNAGETFGAFSPECVDQNITVKGVVMESRIGQEEIAQMEAQALAQDSIDKAEGACCETDAKAKGLTPGASLRAKIDEYKSRIADRKSKEGKDYLSFYYIDAIEYNINK